VPDVQLVRDGAVSVLTIDRPEARNSISRPVMDELASAIDAVAASDARVLGVRGGGDSVFVSGGDLKELAAIRTREDAEAMSMRMRAVLDRLATLEIPVVAGVNGHAFGGGCEMAVACDIRVAADDVRFAFNQVELAIMPAWGGIERLQALVGRGRALYLTTTGSPLDAATALAWGLVEETVPRPAFEARFAAVLERIAAAPREALVGIKGVAERAAAAARPDLSRLAAEAFATTWIAEAHWNAVDAMDRRRRSKAG
jgi:enoyl-CoA hydratase/carnithine racemase